MISREVASGNLSSIAALFNANLHSLRAFCEEVGSLADEQDEQIRDHPFNLLEAELGVPAEELRAEAVAWEARLGIDSSKPWDVNNPTPPQQQAMQKLGESIVALGRENPQAADFYLMLMDRIANVLPVQGELLRRGALTNLWSYFENLLADLIQTYYLMYPRAFPSERTISFAKLREFDSIEEAIEYLMAKEIEKTQRKPLEKQLKYFEKPLNVDIELLRQYREPLTEVSQRRNLLVHNRGVVNHIYLSKIPRAYIQQESIEVGQRLDVTEEYISRALDTVYIAGMVLLQQCWRQWVGGPELLIWADFTLIQKSIYQSLVNGHYQLVCDLSEYGEKIDLTNETNERAVIINHAIALKKLGKHKAMERLLTSRDWAGCGLKYHIALSALRDEHDKLLNLLPEAIDSRAVSFYHLKEWPIFDSVRDDPRFVALLERLREKLEAHA
jgi:hypothetical protein